MAQLFDKLKENQISGRYPYHMPGHKRNMQGMPMEVYYGIDITEIDGFDNLHKPEGILWELMQRAERIFGAETYLLVNGSTGGILSAVAAAMTTGHKSRLEQKQGLIRESERKDTLLMARNCHKSAYHAAYLQKCRIEYLYPDFLEAYGICGGIQPEHVRQALEKNPEIKALLLTSPTYDGIVSDVGKIVQEAHKKQIPVIVDAAHGAHFAIDDRFPKSAVECGADIVIHSIHKTLPALTQTALLHVQGDLIDRSILQRFLQIYQTSSPSYILMAGIEQCIAILEEQREELCDEFFKQNALFEKQIENLQYIRVLSPQWVKDAGFELDIGKKIISVRGIGMTGKELYTQLLEKYGLQMEMAGQDYVTAILTVMDRQEGYQRLIKALTEIDAELQKAAKDSQKWEAFPCAEMKAYPEAVYDIAAAWDEEKETVLLEECENEISAEFVHIYPPGIPLIVPGERFTKAVVEQLLCYRQQGLTIEGLHDHNKRAGILRKETYAQDKDYLYNRASEQQGRGAAGADESRHERCQI